MIALRLIAAVVAIPLSIVNALVLRRSARRHDSPFMEEDPWH